MRRPVRCSDRNSSDFRKMLRDQHKIVLKSDNENAILSLLRNTLKALRIEHVENTQETHPAAYDSSSNANPIVR